MNEFVELNMDELIVLKMKMLLTEKGENFKSLDEEDML